MDLSSLLLVIPLVISVVAARGGHRWAVAIPLAAALAGGLMYASGDPVTGGGDADPGRLIGGVLLVVAVPWTVICAGVVAWVRRAHRQMT